MYSKTTYTGDGSTRTYSIGFDYVNRGDVSAKINGSTTAFEWVNTQTIRFTTAPVSGSTVELLRNTDISEPAVDFVDGSTLTGDDLDKSANQVLFSVQEVYDDMDYWIAWIQANATSGGEGGDGGIHLPPVTVGNNGSFVIADNGSWELKSLDETKSSLGIDPTKTFGTAAYVDTGTTTGKVPLYENFGSAAFRAVGVTNPTDIPQFSYFGTAAWRTAGASVGHCLTVVDVGGGFPGLPAISGASLLGVIHNVQYIRAESQTAYNVNGGAYSSAKTWTLLPLTTKAVDETIGLASVSSGGKLNVAPGTYQVQAKCVAKGMGPATLRLMKGYNGTNTEVARSVTTDSTNGVLLSVSGKASIGDLWGTFYIEVLGETANASTDALGDAHNASGAGNNIYTTLEATRIT